MPGAEAAPPLSPPEFAAALASIGGFEGLPRVAVAVSGGSDSMALMLLAAGWARERGGEAWGLTVDHGLRPESGEEARTVAGWLAARGIPHAILTWRGAKPRSRLQERARATRYRLLAEWCRDAGVLHLLAAHQREDQAETYLIRHRASSGIDGLAGMPAVRELPGCRLVRPLLAVLRARLSAFLAAEGQPWLHDPSNDNPAFERVRLRTAGAGLATDDIVEEMHDLGGQRVARERALDLLIGRAVALHPAGFAALDRAALAEADNDAIERLLGRLAACIGGSLYPVRRERLARLLAALAAQPERARTLGGCRFVPWRGRVLVLREPAAASPPVFVAPGRSLQWDRRFAAFLPAGAAGGLTLGYFHHYITQRGDRARSLMPAAAFPGLPPLTRPVLPAWWDERGLVAVPHLGHYSATVEYLATLCFRPIHALTSAGFAVV